MMNPDPDMFFSGFMFAVHCICAIAAASILIFDTMSRAWRAIWLVFILGNAFGALVHLSKYLARDMEPSFYLAAFNVILVLAALVIVTESEDANMRFLAFIGGALNLIAATMQFTKLLA